MRPLAPRPSLAFGRRSAVWQPRAARPPPRRSRLPSRLSRKTHGVDPDAIAPFFDIEMLPAQHGDCLWIEYGDTSATHRWLVDCGTQPTAAELRRRVESLPKKRSAV